MPAPYLTGYQQLRQIEWGKSWHWDIKFPAAPAPFSSWFPASEYERTLSNLNSHSFTAGNTEFKTPLGASAKDLRLTFYDDDKQTLETWLEEWCNTAILDKDSNTVATLKEAVRELIVLDLDGKQASNRLHQFMVYPEGNISSIRNSNAEPVVLVVNFVVCGHRVVGT